MDTDPTRAVVTVFRSRLRPDANANGYCDLAELMEARARSMPGLIYFDRFTADDGERVSLIKFDTWEHHNSWRDDPEHVAAQHRGRDNFYVEYTVVVCEEIYSHQMSAGTDAATGSATGG